MAPSQKLRLHQLDEFDLAILTVLQRDSATPQRTIGEIVNLSAAAVQRRIARLEKGGVILGNVAILDPATVGQPIMLIVEVQIENERTDLIETTKKNFASTPEVQQCYYVTGETDFVLVITVASMQDYEKLTKKLFFENHNVKHFKTLVVMDRIKYSMNLTLPGVN
ncbi:Lrp/AsnC family transcriptional regulator [Methylobacterium sp. NMS14P]|uniref:Lrp/AsnC family transcriptional regulator n=1 Tax=Methylobacterium sp. NMS14P TaxID=2894310 RepID=UPI002358E4C0|nr:Lrp/AsnC family transcriptional regulator [Methylobacterium sp. NMS14P]WCS25705.1 Lrp/AsnC family transcriptional regulator [Methylobacterium sp. NMS14P]